MPEFFIQRSIRYLHHGSIFLGRLRLRYMLKRPIVFIFCSAIGALAINTATTQPKTFKTPVAVVAIDVESALSHRSDWLFAVMRSIIVVAT